MIVPTYPGRVVPRKDYFGSEIQREVLVQGFSWNLFEALGIFWVLIFAPIRSSLSLEILSTPPLPFPDCICSHDNAIVFLLIL